MAPKLMFANLFCSMGRFRLGLNTARVRAACASDKKKANIRVHMESRDQNAKQSLGCKTVQGVIVAMNTIPHQHHSLAAALGFPCCPRANMCAGRGCRGPQYEKLRNILIKIVGKSARRWTDAEGAKLRQMKRDGATSKEIGAALRSRTRGAVDAKWYRMNKADDSTLANDVV